MASPMVVLIGPPGAGKSKIGKKAAAFLGAAFIDTDQRIVLAHGPIAQIFTEVGEPAFRAIERDTVRDALRERAVISLGGGAVLDPATQADLRPLRVALLTVSGEAVAARISGSKRPLLADESPETRVAAWQKLMDARSGIYRSLATRTWDTSTRPISRIAREIAEWAGSDHPDTAETAAE